MSFFATYDGSSYQLTTAGFTALVIIMIAILLIGCAIFGGKKKFSAKQLAFSAMAIALAMVTSMIKLFDMPMGGSVTLLSMLFIVLIGYWYGLGAGLTAAFAYGILQLVVDPYIISVPQMLVDYLFAFGALGLSGLFSKSKHGLIKGMICSHRALLRHSSDRSLRHNHRISKSQCKYNINQQKDSSPILCRKIWESPYVSQSHRSACC